MLSIALAGCAHRRIESAPPPPVVIRVKDTPPAELTACPVAPRGFPAATADMPAPVRDAAIRLAEAYRAVTGQLDRLIDWSDPKAGCAAKRAK